MRKREFGIDPGRYNALSRAIEHEDRAVSKRFGGRLVDTEVGQKHVQML